MFELEGYTSKQLATLIAEAEKRQLLLANRPKAAAMRAKIDEYVRSHGYTIAELYGSRAGSERSGASRIKRRPTRGKPDVGARRRPGPVAAKYRNPKNPQETWSGRGSQPRWLAREVAMGRPARSFLIGEK
ncbi:H-NS histone family protein [Xanthomonas euvesicatoria pv. eucalypti]|uniref:H-NS histone family protein n=1 Tax=Xanthomonas euvesicatoria TaxID=456327 RepID=UPI0026E25EDC|nr:H-NS histone family protein [Xanthomonas euvesicatoria]MDO7931514.1 H-NS histone family protein [Xanthomonas euvesicatoria pv. eucalypti]MDO7935759.1 H-NS histone family protein [Xanthomonas euvesicatoria pv. eucalypti]MDO7940041.1 H-NS histone family protein [Xanthomonas euvesicatoria pv. eucalypti]MDO7944606.1 H-NS histone family protein [Xanthomonas euvesicatoria pv. eucalypti]MDO7952008.1 H-NS histone family protein [Xanthomonas euvesicatoria pv. eucalypti]